MGEIYALKQGETAEVAQAIREHYMPTSADGDLPTSVPGALLAVADKLDTFLALQLLECFQQVQTTHTPSSSSYGTCTNSRS